LNQQQFAYKQPIAAGAALPPQIIREGQKDAVPATGTSEPIL